MRSLVVNLPRSGGPSSPSPFKRFADLLLPAPPTRLIQRRMEPHTLTHRQDSGAEPSRLVQTLLNPSVLLLVAFAVFSLGIWKARVGFGDDTEPMLAALRAAEAQANPENLYVLAYTLLLRFATPSPVAAALIMRTVVSLGTTLALSYVLTAFRPYLRRSAILIACAVWMATHLNSPIVQYSNLSPFTFTIAAVGLGWLLRRRSWMGLLGFAVAGACAARLRPEYYAPTLLIGALVGTELILKEVAARGGSTGRRRPVIGFWVGALAALVIVGLTFAPKFRGGGRMNKYLLFGLGQCYAAFYLSEHPDAGFHAMTEFQPLLDKTFGNPSGFFEAIGNNPKEAFRYFALNTQRNLKQLPSALLSTRQTAFPSGLLSRVHALILTFCLLLGGALLGKRLLSAWRQSRSASAQRSGEGHGHLRWQLLLLALFCSAASVAIVLLIGSSRYFISWVPLVYLGVAACFDSLLGLRCFQKREWLLVLPILALFCRPLFLDLGPNENYEVNALRTIAPKLPEHPILAGVYTPPYRAYAFRGRADSVNASDTLSADGLRSGTYDVFIVDAAMRSSRVWNRDRPFFEAFVADPASLGYVKLTEAFTGSRDIYYRPRVGR
jgi:hypothetical protein